MHQKEQIFTAKMLVSLFTILKVFPIPVSNVRLSSLCPYPTDICSHHAIDMDKKKGNIEGDICHLLMGKRGLTNKACPKFIFI